MRWFRFISLYILNKKLFFIATITIYQNDTKNRGENFEKIQWLRWVILNAGFMLYIEKVLVINTRSFLHITSDSN